MTNGKWEHRFYIFGRQRERHAMACSACGWVQWFEEAETPYRYCPGCGAKMEQSVKEGEG